MTRKLFKNLSLGILFFAFLVYGQSALASSNMAKAQKGKILLQVEANGEAWYVNPKDEKRYFMGRPSDAFGLMRQLGVGIKTADLKRIKIAASNMAGADGDGDGLSDMFEDAIGTDKAKTDSDGDGHSDYDEMMGGYDPNGSGNMKHEGNFANGQKGKIFLQVEGNGEAWYVNPQNGFRYFMGRPADAFSLMRSLGLGITNINLTQIPTSDGKNNISVNVGDDISVNVGDDISVNVGDDTLQINNPLTSTITELQEKIKAFTAAYDLYQKDTYETLVDDLFVSGSHKDAKDPTDEFFITFTENTLKKLNGINLNNEYTYASDEEEALLPYEKTNDTTIIVGLGVDFISPFELKNENGTWKIDLSMAKDYYTDSEKIENIEFDAEESELEVYLMGKFEDALEDYKTNNSQYPKYLNQVLSLNPALKDYVEDMEYAVFPENNPTKCHLGIDVLDDESKLSSDSDFDSLKDSYLNGFDGSDPVYDKLME